MSNFKVGASIVNIDCPVDQYPAQTFTVECEEKYDDCNLRAMAIETDCSKLLILAYEISDIPEVPQLEAQIANEIGYDENDIVITVTHNHASPCDRGARRCSDEQAKAAWREKYLKIELEASLKAAREAVTNLRPAKYGFGEIDSFLAQNEITRNSEIGFYCDKNGNGYVDNTLAILAFKDENDKPICFLMNHPCHASFAMGPNANGKHATSGNFTGIASRFLEDYFPGSVALWTSGAAGNLHPLIEEHIKISYTDGYVGKPTAPDGTGFVFMEVAGRIHGVDAVNCVNRISEFSGNIELKHIKDSIMLPTQQLQEHKVMGAPGNPFESVDYGTGVRSNQAQPAPAFEEIICPPDPDHPANLKVEMIQIGDVAIACLGCEMFCQIGRDIKNALPAKHSFVITHTPGYVGHNEHAVGYIVDKSSIGSHNSKLYRNLIPGAYDEMIVQEFVKLYDEIN